MKANEKFDWQTIIRKNIIKLKIVGLWPSGNESYQKNLYTLWAIISITFLNFGHNFFQMINIIFIFDNLQAIVQTVYVTISEVAGLLKAYYVIRNMKTLKKLMVTLQSDTFQPKNERQLAMVKPSFYLWKINYFMYWLMSAGAIFFWCIHPILDVSNKDYPLPFLAWYPWSTKRSPQYQLTYLYQVFGLIFIATTAISVDTLIAALNAYIGAQFDILCDDIKHLCDQNDSSKNLNKKLIKCVEHHREIVRFAFDTQKFANWIVLAQFFVSAVTIGITVFQMTVSVPFSSEFFSCLSFTFSMILEIFMYCWFGNEVEIKSSRIVYAAFESNWINASIQVKKNMLFFVMRCQTSMKMSALNLFYLSLDTFMRIIRTSWSYFALLHQVSLRQV